MTEVISVKFKEGGRAYYFDPDGNTVNIGDSVIVGTQNGNEFGTVSEANHSVDDGAIVKPLRKMLRKATERDFKRLEENKKKQTNVNSSSQSTQRINVRSVTIMPSKTTQKQTTCVTRPATVARQTTPNML